MRPDLDKNAAAEFDELCGRRSETYRLPDIAPPVVSIQRSTICLNPSGFLLLVVSAACIYHIV
jgi:hypothetical protein